MRVPVLVVLSAMAFGPGQNPRPTHPSTYVDVPASGSSMPMLDVGGRPIVNVTINGKGPYPFILDTGADFTVIDPALASELMLPPDRQPEAPDAVRIENFQAAAAAIHGLRAGTRLGLLQGLGATPPRGVLSASAFPGQLVVLDYPGKTVSIVPGELPAPDEKRIFQYGADEELPVIPVRVAGHEYRIHLDSGSPGGIMLPLKYVPDLPLEAPPVEVGRARTAAGTFPVEAATVRGSIEIGEFVLDQKDVRFSDLRPGTKPGIGNVGARVLRDFIVTFDSKSRRVKFDRPPR